MSTRRLSPFSWFARLALVAGAVCLFLSPDHPYWEMKLHAAQYPNGLTVVAYPDRIAGDVREIDGLNHYIGMKELEKAAEFERAIGRPAVFGMAVVMLLVAVFSTRWSPLLLLPVILFPALFIADLYWWLREYGLNLDPHAAMSSSIKPFVPTVLGEGKVGQFKTEAWIGDGMTLALIAAGTGLLFVYARRFEWYREPTVESRPAAAAKTLAVVAGVLLAGGAVRAAEWDVRPSGPVTTIAAAVQAAAPGDTIHVYG
ncbi:MAG TPA: hypothetical protein VM597_23515, partial [Gemmataceae bacterium]|nr:hypothetical protein [Gemmataceae bacterium]